jgi:tol-pal system-associated acyl-CoA thioesterase
MNINNSLKIKIYYEDTDAGGVVYYANYLKFMERARTEYLADRKIDVSAYHNKGFIFAVVDAEIHYKHPAKLGDIVEITTDIIETTKVTLKIRHHIKKNETTLVESVIRLACINPEGKPQKIPEEIIKAITVPAIK